MDALARRESSYFRTTTTPTPAGNLRSQVVPTDPLAGLDHIAREVQAAGIREVTGHVIIDDRLFAAAEATGSGPKRVSPIVINDNVIDVLARPADKAGEPAMVTFQPATQFMTMDAQVMTVDAGKSPVTGGSCGRSSRVRRARAVAGGPCTRRQDLRSR